MSDYEPQVYIFLRHRIFGRIPYVRRWFCVTLAKPLSQYDPINESVLIEEWQRRSRMWQILVSRDLWPNEVRR